MTKIFVAFSKQDDAVNIKNLLVRSGYSVVVTTTTGARILSSLDDYQDGIIVCGYRLADMFFYELKDSISDNFEMLLLASPAKINEVFVPDVVSVAMPLKINDLLNTLEMMQNTVIRKRKKRKALPTKRNEEDKNIILNAKKILMEKNNMTEEEAHRYIQKASMDSGTNMVETAQMVITIMLQ